MLFIQIDTVLAPFAGVRAAGGFVVAAAAVATGAFVLLASRAAVGSPWRGSRSYSTGDSGAPFTARERTRSSSTPPPWTRATTMLGKGRYNIMMGRTVAL